MAKTELPPEYIALRAAIQGVRGDARADRSHTMSDEVGRETCSICSGAVPDRVERSWQHTALCAAVVAEELGRSTTALVTADRHIEAADQILNELLRSRVFDAQMQSDLTAVRDELALAHGAAALKNDDGGK